MCMNFLNLQSHQVVYDLNSYSQQACPNPTLTAVVTEAWLVNTFGSNLPNEENHLLSCSCSDPSDGRFWFWWSALRWRLHTPERTNCTPDLFKDRVFDTLWFPAYISFTFCPSKVKCIHDGRTHLCKWDNYQNPWLIFFNQLNVDGIRNILKHSRHKVWIWVSYIQTWYIALPGCWRCGNRQLAKNAEAENAEAGS